MFIKIVEYYKFYGKENRFREQEVGRPDANSRSFVAKSI